MSALFHSYLCGRNAAEWLIDMEHRHIPSQANGEPLSKKAIFLRGEDSFLKDVWYGRCAVCGEFIRPPKLWYWLRNGLIYLLAVPFALVVGRMLANTTPDNVVRHYLFTIFNCMVMLVISKLLSNASLALGRWQSFPEGSKGEKLYQRNGRKRERVFWVRAAVAWLFAAASFAFLFFSRFWFAHF